MLRLPSDPEVCRRCVGVPQLDASDPQWRLHASGLPPSFSRRGAAAYRSSAAVLPLSVLLPPVGETCVWIACDFIFLSTSLAFQLSLFFFSFSFPFICLSIALYHYSHFLSIFLSFSVSFFFLSFCLSVCLSFSVFFSLSFLVCLF